MDHSSQTQEPVLALSPIHRSSPCILVSVDLSLPMDMMRWAGSRLEAEPGFGIFESRVDLQHRVGHLLQAQLSQQWQLPARSAHSSGLAVIGEWVSEGLGGAHIALTLLWSVLSLPGPEETRMGGSGQHYLFVHSFTHSFFHALSSKLRYY